MKNEPSEDAQSPFTDISMIDDEDKSKLALSFTGDVQNVTSGIATYVPQQKPEWKRYKQYTRNDIMSAIEAVRKGMSALQAARKYGVPSRTLYDKVKKLGITTSRIFKRGSNGSSVCFPYGISGTSSPYGGHTSDADEAGHAALLEASFLQHAMDGRGGGGGGNVGDREALAAMAAAAAAHHAAAAGNSTSPGNHGMARSPSPGLGMGMELPKYMRPNSLTPSPAEGSDHHHSETNGSSERERDDDEDQVEDLSMHRKPEPVQQQSRVIMSPMNQVSTIIKQEELKDSLRDEPPGRREISVDENE